MNYTGRKYRTGTVCSRIHSIHGIPRAFTIGALLRLCILTCSCEKLKDSDIKSVIRFRAAFHSGICVRQVILRCRKIKPRWDIIIPWHENRTKHAAFSSDCSSFSPWERRTCVKTAIVAVLVKDTRFIYFSTRVRSDMPENVFLGWLEKKIFPSQLSMRRNKKWTGIMTRRCECDGARRFYGTQGCLEIVARAKNKLKVRNVALHRRATPSVVSCSCCSCMSSCKTVRVLRGLSAFCVCRACTIDCESNLLESHSILKREKNKREENIRPDRTSEISSWIVSSLLASYSAGKPPRGRPRQHRLDTPWETSWRRDWILYQEVLESENYLRRSKANLLHGRLVYHVSSLSGHSVDAFADPVFPSRIPLCEMSRKLWDEWFIARN